MSLLYKLIENNDIDQDNYTNLLTDQDCYYYNDFNTAINDIKLASYDNGSNVNNELPIAVFIFKGVHILRLLSNVDITNIESLTIDFDLIIDLNGFELLFGNGKIDISKRSLLFYGIKENSKFIINTNSSNNKRSIDALEDSAFVGFIGGSYITNDDNTIFSSTSFYLNCRNIFINNCTFSKNTIIDNEDSAKSFKVFSIRPQNNKFIIKNSNITYTSPGNNKQKHYICIYSTSKKTIIENCNIKNLVNSYKSKATQLQSLLTIINNSNIETLTDGSIVGYEACGCTVGGYFPYISNANMDVYKKSYCFINDSYIAGVHSSLSCNNSNVYVKNCILESPEHGVYNGTKGLLYLKDCTLEQKKLRDDHKITYGGSIYCGYGSVTYADNCDFIGTDFYSVCFNQRDDAPTQSTLYASNCRFNRPIRPTTTPTGSTTIFLHSKLVLGEGNELAYEFDNSSTVDLEENNNYYGNKPEFAYRFDYYDKDISFLIKQNYLDQNKYINLLSNQTCYYYNDFNTAINNINSSCYENSIIDNIDDASLMMFEYNSIPILRLLSNIDISNIEERMDIKSDVILDLNGFELSVGNARIRSYFSSLLIYGMKENSKITINKNKDAISSISSRGSDFFGILGGYYLCNSTNINEGSIFRTYLTKKVFINNCTIEGNVYIEKNTPKIDGVFRTNYVLSIIYSDECDIKNSNISLHPSDPSSLYNNNYYSVEITSVKSLIKNSFIKNNINTSNSEYTVGLYLRAIVGIIDNCRIENIISKENIDSGVGIDTYNYILNTYDGATVKGSSVRGFVFIKNSYVSGTHSNMQVRYCYCYCLNSEFESPDHGLYLCRKALLYLKNCILRQKPLVDEQNVYFGGAMYCGYGSSAYADNCDFLAYNETFNSVCFNQRDNSPTQSTLYASNCRFNYRIRRVSTTTGDPDFPHLRSKLVLGQGNELAYKFYEGNGENDVLLEENDNYYGDPPEFVDKFDRSIDENLRELNITKLDLIQLCNKLSGNNYQNLTLSNIPSLLDKLINNN